MRNADCLFEKKNNKLNQPKYITFELSEFHSILNTSWGNTEWLAHLIT